MNTYARFLLMNRNCRSVEGRKTEEPEVVHTHVRGFNTEDIFLYCFIKHVHSMMRLSTMTLKIDEELALNFFFMIHRSKKKKKKFESKNNNSHIVIIQYPIT